MGVNLTGSSAANNVNVSDNGLHSKLIDVGGGALAQPNATLSPTRGGVIVQGLNDAVGRHLRTDRLGNLAQSTWAAQFLDPFEGANLNSNRWLTTNSSQGSSQVQGLLTLNSGALTTASSYLIVSGASYFVKNPRTPMIHRSRVRYATVANAACAWGVVSSANLQTTSMQQNGIYFQDTAGGALVPTVAFGGSFLTGNSIPVVAGNYYTYDIMLTDDDVTFTVLRTADEVVISEQVIRLPNAQTRLQAGSHWAPFFHTYCGATAPASAPQLWVSDIKVGSLEQNLGRNAATQAAALGNIALVNPQTGVTNTVNGTNSTAYTTGTLSNTAAAYTGLSGNFVFAAPAGAATDYLLVAVQVPALARFVCTGVDIQLHNEGAAVAGTNTTLHWFIGINATSASLTSSNIRKSVGVQSLLSGAAIGAQAPTISRQFSTPMYVESGRYIMLGFRVPYGTATASQLLQGTFDLEGYWE